MTLVDRVSAFFLAALAIVLLAYSLLLYAVINYYLYHRFDEQLQAAFNTLVAAIEVEPDDVKFEPTDHTIRLGAGRDSDDIRWSIYDERQQLVAHSQNLTSAEGEALLEFARTAVADEQAVRQFDHWRVLRYRVSAATPKPIAERDPLERGTLVMVVARSNVDLRENLNRIALVAIALPAAFWIFAAIAGRWYCRRALSPVQRMARQARQMSTADGAMRLAVESSGDELADLAAAFNQLLDRLHYTLERQQRFAGDAAHQLRTPLTVLQGQIEVTLRRERTPQEHREALAVLLAQTIELRQLVESLLFLARAEGVVVADDMQQLQVGHWLNQYLKQWETHPRRTDVQLVTQCELTVRTSPHLLGQLLDNLVGNALKYSEAGSPVVLSLDGDEKRARLAVRDQGIGIEPADLPSIFDPFVRSAAARSSGIAGTGLGLAIARRIAEALGAQLKCESEPNKGSAFTVLLPLDMA